MRSDGLSEVVIMAMCVGNEGRYWFEIYPNSALKPLHNTKLLTSSHLLFLQTNPITLLVFVLSSLSPNSGLKTPC